MKKLIILFYLFWALFPVIIAEGLGTGFIDKWWVIPILILGGFIQGAFAIISIWKPWKI